MVVLVPHSSISAQRVALTCRYCLGKSSGSLWDKTKEIVIEKGEGLFLERIFLNLFSMRISARILHEPNALLGVWVVTRGLVEGKGLGGHAHTHMTLTSVPWAKHTQSLTCV